MLFGEQGKHSSRRNGRADNAGNIRAHSVHQDVASRELLRDHLLADARRHRNGGYAGRADDRVDLAAGDNLHDLTEADAARGAEYEGDEPEADDLDRRQCEE